MVLGSIDQHGTSVTRPESNFRIKARIAFKVAAIGAKR